MPTAKEAKKMVQTETKFMSMIEKIMDKILDEKMKTRIANWVYQKYVLDLMPLTPPLKPVDNTPPYKPVDNTPPYKPTYPYAFPKPYPTAPAVSAYAAPFGDNYPDVTWGVAKITRTVRPDFHIADDIAESTHCVCDQSTSCSCEENEECSDCKCKHGK